MMLCVLNIRSIILPDALGDNPGEHIILCLLNQMGYA